MFLWKKTISGFAIVVGIILAAGVAQAQTTWYVDDDNFPGPGSGSEADSAS